MNRYRHIVCIQALNRFKSNKLKRAIIANADADLLCALTECAYNILKKNIPLTELQRRRLSKYRTKLRELAQRRTPVARRRRILLQTQVGEGQSGGFLSAFLAPLASSVFLPLLREVLLDDLTKVTLYNQVLQRYNVLSDKHVKEPFRVVAVNESVTGSGPGVGAGQGPGSEGAVRTPSSELEATIVDTVPKTMQAKARRLMEHLKRDIAWTARGELIHEGVPVVGSNVVDLVNDLLRKRKTDPTGWQPFARQLSAINLPMEFVGNVVKRAYIRQATTVTPSRRSANTPRAAGSARRSLSWTPLARQRRRMEHSMPTPPPRITQGFVVISWLGRLIRWHDACPQHSVRHANRSKGRVSFRRRCDILQWTLLAW